jgi:hypothetical protein
MRTIYDKFNESCLMYVSAKLQRRDESPWKIYARNLNGLMVVSAAWHTINAPLTLSGLF